ncbi:MAG: YlbF family regulator [Chloroflexota bacterium]
MIELDMKRATVDGADIGEAVAELSSALKAHPSYSALRTAHQALQADEEAQKLLADLQTRQQRLQFSANGTEEAEFQKQLERFYALPVVTTYDEAQDAVVDLLKEVDSIISTTAGIDFAANARRSCCGG